MSVRLEGFHAVKHALRFAPGLVDEVRVADPEAVRALASALAPDVLDPLLARAVRAEVAHPTGVEADARRPAEDREVLQRRASRLVVLDAPRQPRAPPLRRCRGAAAGASGVVVTGDLDPWHPAVLRGAAGLHYALPVLRAEPDDVAGPVVVLDADGDPDAALPADAALVVGSERVGVGPRWRQRADAVLALPMRSGVSSLNLATAVAAALYRS